MTITDLVNWD